MVAAPGSWPRDVQPAQAAAAKKPNGPIMGPIISRFRLISSTVEVDIFTNEKAENRLLA